VEWRRSIALGVTAGLLAGLPQVFVTQVVEKPLGLPDDKADVGPRLVGRLAKEMGTSVEPEMRWALAALFHFGYAAGWGGLYALVDRWLRPKPLIGAAAMAGLIYLAAFSRWGGGTRTGTEPHPDRRPVRDAVLQWTAALSFSVPAVFIYRWLADASTAHPTRAGEGVRVASSRRVASA
jgi:hypothetical protein